MSPPAKSTEASTPAIHPEGGSNLPRIPRKWRDDAIRVCLDLGYTVSGAQAWRLIKDWRAWRDADTRDFIASEFGEYIQRRGDLLIVRNKRHTPWRVAT